MTLTLDRKKKKEKCVNEKQEFSEFESFSLSFFFFFEDDNILKYMQMNGSNSGVFRAFTSNRGSFRSTQDYNDFMKILTWGVKSKL